MSAGMAAVPGCGLIRTKENFDTIIKGGTIYDGSGSPGFVGDIAWKDGRIAAVGRNLGRSAANVIEAKGLAVTPGFVDIHSHTDTNLFIAPKGDSRIFQGVTSEVGGNCGEAPFVCSDKRWAEIQGTLRHGYPAWRNIDGFYDALERNKIGINYSSLVGHGDLREAVVGPYNVPASDDDLKKMCEMLETQLEMGAIGISYGLEYAPGCYCDTREMVELCRVIKKHDALYSIHMRNEDDHVLEAVDEAILAAKLSGARLEISHLKAQNPANFDKLDQILKKIEDARAEGEDVTFDRYPYTAFSTGFTTFIPIELRDGTDEDIMRRLEDKKTAEKIGKYAHSRLERFGGAQQVLVAGCSAPGNEVYSGKNIAECCKISGMEEWEMIRYLLITEKLHVRQATFAMKEDNLKRLYAHPLSMPGSDGSVYSPEGSLGKSIPHPRAYGTFPRFFEKFVREDKVLDMATAVHKCTALPAGRAHMKDRGLLIPGYIADVTVFNPDTIADVATYAKPHTFARGIEHVFVNGVQAISAGQHTGSLAGEIIRRG